MHAEVLIRLIEEMIDIKIRQHAGSTSATTAHLTPELARVLAHTKMADKDRLIRIRSELLALMEAE